MPSIYTHYRFGKLLLPRLSADVRGTIARNRALFDAGLQGPDFFFYYKPGNDTEIRRLASVFHRQSGREFFTAACASLHADSPEEELSYLYGLLAHYCLDSVCHPFVHEQTDTGELGHNALESEFERFLLARDGVKKPHAHPRSRYLKLAKEHAPLLSRFYAPATAEEVHEAVHIMQRVIALLTYSNAAYCVIAKGILHLLGNENIGLLIPKTPDMRFAWHNTEMLRLFDDALKRYLPLLEQMRSHLTCREPLGTDFDAIFG